MNKKITLIEIKTTASAALLKARKDILVLKSEARNTSSNHWFTERSLKEIDEALLIINNEVKDEA